MSEPSNRSPVRRLYDSLCGLMSADDLHMNLETLDDYLKLEGDPEPRFCEWAYDALSRRTLVADLKRSVLRRTDLEELARKHGVTPSAHNSFEILMRQTLASIGIKEPEIPPELLDGISILRRFREWADSELAGMSIERLEPEPFSTDPVAECRRATERLLKLIALFLYDGGLADQMVQIWTAGQHGFEPQGPISDLPSKLQKAKLGPLNYLLRAISRAVAQDFVHVPFLSRTAKLWDDPVFEAVGALSDALNVTVHDSDARKGQRLLARQNRAVMNVLKKIETNQIRVPRLVQFFRRYTDGHAVHCEGYSQDGQIVRCFETVEYELHKPYLMCAATNPASVDMVCVPLREYFRSEV